MSQKRAGRSADAPHADHRRARRGVPSLVWALAGCAVLAAASLTLPLTLVFDPWGWLIWARELGAGGLDTSAGPSWKPLPVLLALPFAGSEQLGPQWWLWLARSGWLAVPVLAALLAARLAGGGRGAWAAGALAAAGTLLLHDPFTGWVRQFAGGLSEPLLCALVLGAVLAALAERPWLTGILALGACLLRPEAWPFAALWALWAVRSGQLPLAAGLAGAVLVPLAWFVPDLVGAGDPLAGAERAREGSGAPAGEALEVLGRALALAPAALWLGAAWLLAGAWRGRRQVGASRQDRAALALGAGALAWIAVVAALAAAGYAGLPRFMAPAATLVCVLGAVGLVRGFDGARAAPAGGGRPGPAGSRGVGGIALRRERALARTAGRRTLGFGLALLVLAGCALDVGLRAQRVPGEVDAARSFAAGVDELFTLADDHGEELRACPPLATSDLFTLTALAWRLELPVSAVTYSGGLYPRRGTAILGPSPPPGVRTQARLRAEPFATEGRWEAYRAGPCGGP